MRSKIKKKRDTKIRKNEILRKKLRKQGAHEEKDKKRSSQRKRARDRNK